MTERPNLGQVLRGFGRIDESDQEAAVQYQRTHGGYFGEALLALGLVTSEEVEFGLATQFDLPYVFPDPDSVDREAAELVSPEWALAHLAIPIARSGYGLTVVVDSPIKAGPLEELERRTGLEIQLAIASPAKIRELIREVYQRGPTPDESPSACPALTLDEFLDLAVAESAALFGISVRSHRALGWWDERGTIHRRHLTVGWEDALERRLSPGGGGERAGETHQAEWEARLSYRGAEIGVEVRSLEAERGREILIRPVREEEPLDHRFFPPPSSVVGEVRLLARSGVARFVVTTDPPELRARLLPSLPSLLLGSSYRVVHLTDEAEFPPEGVAPAVLTLPVPSGSEDRDIFLRDLRAFRFDAITASLPGDPAAWLAGVAGAASVVFVSLSEPEIRSDLLKAGIGWRLRVREEAGGRLDWEVRPLEV
ncbi:MAG: hypothetical protein EA421_08575 [Gemmatimonadales bacterium]|nr:MAG: hypothetical protein EA421_08575 [Gemmatimonadales bacterium]